MTSVIAAPCVDIDDRPCLESSPTGRIDEVLRMPDVDPGEK